MSEEPRSEFLIAEVISALEQITTKNGYTYSPREVFRWDADVTEARATPPVIMLQSEGWYRRPRGDIMTVAQDKLLDIVLMCNVLKEHGSTVEMDRVFALAMADVEQAIEQGVDWNALEARIEAYESRPYPVISETELFDGFQVQLQISFSLHHRRVWQHIPRAHK